MPLFGTGPLKVVLVNTIAGSTLKGALVEDRRNALILRAASAGNVVEGGRVVWTRLDGDVVIPRENVDYYQESIDVKLLDE